MNDYAEQAMIAFAMHCDVEGLTVEQGRELATEIAEAVESAAGDREYVRQLFKRSGK